MRFLVMVKATKESEAGVMPTKEMLSEMGKFNEELVKAGIMLAGEGLPGSDSLAVSRQSKTVHSPKRKSWLPDSGSGR